MDCPSRSAPAGLPYDAMVEILARLPARSVYRSKCVAKAWRDLIDDPLNRKKLPQTLEGFFFVDKPGHLGGGDLEHFGFINFLARSVPLDIDPRFSFLTKPPEIENLFFLDSCNGLLLFEHCGHGLESVGYIVCNPATRQWKTVPCPPLTYGSEWYPSLGSEWYISLAFDPAVSSHFHLIQFWQEGLDEEVEPLEDQVFVLSVHTYSSETGTWSQSQTDWNEQGQLEGWRHQGNLDYIPRHAYVNGTLHLIVLDKGQCQIVALDVQGKTKRIITVPAAPEGRSRRFIGYICQSQGCLHYINNDFDAHDPKESYELSIWVLQEYNTQEWVLKHTVSFIKLFGRISCTGGRSDFFIVAIHQDCNVVFFLQPLNRLIAYDMDRKEVSVIATFENENWDARIAPYIPYFSESPTLTS